MHATIIPRKRGELLNSYRWWETTVAPSLDGGAPFRTSLDRIPFTAEGSADHFQRGMPC